MSIEVKVSGDLFSDTTMYVDDVDDVRRRWMRIYHEERFQRDFRYIRGGKWVRVDVGSEETVVMKVPNPIRSVLQFINMAVRDNVNVHVRWEDGR